MVEEKIMTEELSKKKELWRKLSNFYYLKPHTLKNYFMKKIEPKNEKGSAKKNVKVYMENIIYDDEDKDAECW